MPLAVLFNASSGIIMASTPAGRCEACDLAASSRYWEKLGKWGQDF